ncbi:MAG: hypothetical protein ACXWPK_05190 [Isosphaeraceae bacterium]
MLTVDDYGAIRRAHRDGMPIKRIALEFKHSRNTIRKILKHPQPNPTPRERNRTAPVLGPFQSIIDQILLDDEGAPPNADHGFHRLFKYLMFA